MYLRYREAYEYDNLRVLTDGEYRFIDRYNNYAITKGIKNNVNAVALESIDINRSLKNDLLLGRGKYSKFWWGVPSGKSYRAPRRYFQQPQVLGFDIFHHSEEWLKAQQDVYDYLNVNYTDKVWNGYLKFCRESLDNNNIFINIMKMVLMSRTEDDSLALCSDLEQLECELMGMANFFKQTFLAVPFAGKLSEIVAIRHINSLIENQGLACVRFGEKEDISFAVDATVVDMNNNNVPLAGISIKGESYKSLNVGLGYQFSGNKYENEGHDRFVNNFHAPVVVVKSSAYPTALVLDHIKKVVLNSLFAH